MLPPEFHFLRPAWLLLLPVLPLLALWVARMRRDRRRWEAVCDPALLSHVLIDRAPGRRSTRPGLLLALVGLLTALALAGPTWERLPQPVYRAQSALVLALDLSRSMAAGDLAPSRLARARYAVRDILAARRDGQTGLVVFAADAFAVSPLTDDTATIMAQLPALEPGIMPAQGSRPERALELAVALLEQAGAASGEILLLTDGAADAAAARAAARAAAAAGYPVSVLAVGTAEGAPIPAADGGFVTDPTGGIVVPRLDGSALRRLAGAGDGAYLDLHRGPVELAALAERWRPREPHGAETGRVTDTWLDRGPWVAALLLPLALLGFRRGVLALAACALLPMAPEAHASGWDELWSRPDQRGAAAFAAGDAETASRLFEDRRWRAAAAYRAGDYGESAAALEGLDDAESLYNRGNALARAGRFDEALASYEEALAQSPGHDDARHNRDLLQQLARQQTGAGGESGDRPEDAQSDGGAAGERGEGSGGDDSGQRSQDGQSTADQSSSGEADESSASSSPGRGNQGDPDAMSAAERQALDRQAASQASGADAAAQDAQADGEQADRTESAPTAAEGEPAEPPPGQQPDGRVAATGEPDESEQATEQWLRRIPDDPGGLLRRKFYYQYRERGSEAAEDEPTW